VPLTPELGTAYHQADYVVFGHRRGTPELVIRIGRLNKGLDELLEHLQAASAAFVTAANPHGEKRSYEENQAACEALSRSPLIIGYPWFRGESRDPAGGWPPEPSLLIVGMPRKEARELGLVLQQNAVVFVEKGAKPELIVLV
jgi:hypothetical protein